MDFSISILVPVYNASKHLDTCLDSIVKQDYKDYEVIIVDDGSTDGSEYICNKYAEAYRQIKVIHQENKGVSATRQTLLDNARGDYILFVDADDYIDSNALSQLVLMASHTKADVIQCSYISFNNDGECVYVPVKLKSRTEHLDILNIIMSDSSQCALWNRLIRKIVIDDNGIRFGDGISLGEDRCFLLALYQNAISTTLLDFPFYHYRADHYAKTSNSYALNTYLGFCNAVNVLKYLKSELSEVLPINSNSSST